MTILSAYICISAHEFRIQNFHMENPRHDHLSVILRGSVCIFYIFFISENLIISLLLLHSSALR